MFLSAANYWSSCPHGNTITTILFKQCFLRCSYRSGLGVGLQGQRITSTHRRYVAIIENDSSDLLKKHNGGFWKREIFEMPESLKQQQ